MVKLNEINVLGIFGAGKYAGKGGRIGRWSLSNYTENVLGTLSTTDSDQTRTRTCDLIYSVYKALCVSSTLQNWLLIAYREVTWLMICSHEHDQIFFLTLMLAG